MPLSRFVASFAVVVLVSCSSLAVASNDPFDLDLWEVDAMDHRVESFRGRHSLLLDRGVAVLTDSSFVNGVIEFDIAISEGLGFAGIHFRDDGVGNYEHFYIRSHLSGKPDACQYTPVFNDISGWQIYAGPRFNAPVEYVFDRWMHLKLVVSGGRAEVYLDSDEPVFVIPELIQETRAGRIAISAFLAPARFANVRVTPTDSPAMVGGGAAAAAVADTIVDSWSVSAPFDGSVLDGRYQIDTDEPVVKGWSPNWTALESGERGIANLARLAGIGKDGDTVIAKVMVHADEARTIPARFGFSDRVRVYLNGRLLFAGDDSWRARDYRFLGTIGLHGELFLPLEKGANTIWFAVTEEFGGWGVVLDLPE